MLEIRRIGLLLVAGFLCLYLFVPQANAQMMGNYPTINPSITPSPEDQQEIIDGQKLYQQLQNNQIPCSSLKNTDFDKIGEYVMEKKIGNSQRHAQLNQMMKNMMGGQGETNMHIALGQRATGCYINTTTGGVSTMMWGWPGSMMGWYGFGTWGIFTLIFWLTGLIVLVLLGVFLLRQIRKK